MHLLTFPHSHTPCVKLQSHYKHVHITVYKAYSSHNILWKYCQRRQSSKDQLLQRAHHNDVLLQPLVAAVIVMGTTEKVSRCYPHVLVQYINDWIGWLLMTPKTTYMRGMYDYKGVPTTGTVQVENGCCCCHPLTICYELVNSIYICK